MGGEREECVLVWLNKPKQTWVAHTHTQAHTVILPWKALQQALSLSTHQTIHGVTAFMCLA